MAIRKSINQIREELNAKVQKAGQYFLDRQSADLGNYSGTVKVPNSENLVYARLENGQVVQVFNNVAPNIYNWKVYVGRDKSQPALFKVLEVRWVYNMAQTVAYVLFHHRQHEYPNPDTVWIWRDQFMPLLVLPAGGFSVRLYGDVIPTLPNPIHVPNETLIDLSGYINTTGANYVLLEIDTNGDIGYVVGDEYSDIVTLRLTAPFPPLTEGNIPVATIEFYAGQTEIRRDSTERNIIDMRSFTSAIPVGTGSQINTADAGTPDDVDLFGFWSVADSILKNITWENIVALLKAYFDTLYNPLVTTHLEPLTTNVPREFDAWVIEGALAVTTDAAMSILATKPMKLSACYISSDTPGTAGSTIVDINLNGVTIFTTAGNRPELEWDDADGYAISGDPEVVDVVVGDKLSIDIDQVATGVSGLRISLMEASNELVFDLDNELIMTEVEN